AVERLVIEQRIARPGWPPETATADKDLVRAALDIVGLVILGKARRHRRADAGTDENVKGHAALAKRLVDARMRRAKAAAAGGDEADGAAGQKADQAVDVQPVLKRHVVMHEAGQPRE